MSPTPPQADEAAHTSSKHERDSSPASQGNQDGRASKSLKATPKSKPGHKKEEPALLPPRGAPYYFYTDHSREADEDPLTPVTPPNSVPAFPIKMHAILSMPELASIIGWDTHGRSFRILKPKQFERDVLPLYFEHSKFSSFTRQVSCVCVFLLSTRLEMFANGWLVNSCKHLLCLRLIKLLLGILYICRWTTNPILQP